MEYSSTSIMVASFLLNWVVSIQHVVWAKSMNSHFHYLQLNIRNCSKLMQSDFWGVSNTQSSIGYQFHIHFIDAYSKFRFIFIFLETNLMQSIAKLGWIAAWFWAQTDWVGEYRAFSDDRLQSYVVIQTDCVGNLIPSLRYT